MSSILKALKKLEEQKTEKKEGAVNLARDILRTSRKAKKPENWILPTAIVAFLLTGVMVSYFLVGGFSPESQTAPSLPVAESEQNEKGTEDSVAENAPVDEDVQVGQGGSNPDENIPATADDSSESSDKTAVQVVVDGPEAVFGGKSDQASSENMQPEEQVAASSMDNQGGGSVADEEEPARNQQQTAATLKQTAQVLKKTAEALREKAVQARQAALSDRQAEPSATASSEVKAGSDDTTSRLSSAAADDGRDSELPKPHIYRPTGSEADQTAAADASEPADEASEEALPRVLTSTTDSGQSRWSTSSASGTFPDLTVSEIHYQYEVKNRRAVVNDLTVNEGAVIDGARVDRILKDRVRFVFNGQYKEVRLSE